MTVFTRQKEDSMYRSKNEIQVHERIASIVEDEKVVRLIRNKNRETLVNKEKYEIVKIDIR